MAESKPKTVNGQAVWQIIDEYRIWPNWWEGYLPRDYYLLDTGNKTIEIYQTAVGWFWNKIYD